MTSESAWEVTLTEGEHFKSSYDQRNEYTRSWTDYGGAFNQYDVMEWPIEGANEIVYLQKGTNPIVELVTQTLDWVPLIGLNSLRCSPSGGDWQLDLQLLHPASEIHPNDIPTAGNYHKPMTGPMRMYVKQIQISRGQYDYMWKEENTMLPIANAPSYSRTWTRINITERKDKCCGHCDAELVVPSYGYECGDKTIMDNMDELGFTSHDWKWHTREVGRLDTIDEMRSKLFAYLEKGKTDIMKWSER
tara:strand:- start:1157 stop:1897 length:741 start_codon:yes stop_codon:yes gene_type:complete